MNKRTIVFILGLVGIGFGLGAQVLRGVGHRKQRSKTYKMALEDLSFVVGLGKGKCCKDSANLCGGAGNGECHAPLPWKCSCTNPDSPCHRYVSPPRKERICVDSDPEHSCEIVKVLGCYAVDRGTCNDDAGGWSFWGFCYMCGCNYTEFAIWEGQRDACKASSNLCPEKPF